MITVTIPQWYAVILHIVCLIGLVSFSSFFAIAILWSIRGLIQDIKYTKEMARKSAEIERLKAIKESNDV